MDKPRTRGHKPAAITPHTPLQLRPKNGPPPMSPTLIQAYPSKVLKPSSTQPTKNKTQEKQESTTTKLRQPIASTRPTRARTAPNSPSAWALSPGRASPCALRPEPVPVVRLKVKESSNSGGVSRVLKFFGHEKKVSTIKKEDYHQFRVLHNRLLQWRFVNARAEVAMGAQKRTAEGKTFSVWLQICKMRNSIMEKRILIQKLRHEIKLYGIISPELLLLNEWTKIEKRNIEAVGRVERKLSAVSLNLPLIDDAKGDAESIYNAMSMAVGVMNSIEVTITDLFTQVEILQEFYNTVKQQKEYEQELREWINIIVPLVARERSLQVALIQAAKEQSYRD